LALKPRDRPQSVAEFRALMDDPHYVAPPSEPALTAPLDFDLTLETPVVAHRLPASSAPSAFPRAAPQSAAERAQQPAPQDRPVARGGSRQRVALLVAALALLALAGLAFSLYRDSRPEAADAVREVAPVTQRAAEPVTEPAPVPVPIPAQVVMPAASASPAESVPAPAPEQAPEKAAAPAPEPAPTAKPTRQARPAPPPPAEARRTAPAPAEAAGCSDILKKGSLEPLTAAETAFLRRHCQ